LIEVAPEGTNELILTLIEYFATAGPDRLKMLKELLARILPELNLDKINVERLGTIDGWMSLVDTNSKMLLAKREDIAEHILEQLARDEDNFVQLTIANKDKLPESVITELARSIYPQIRAYIAIRDDLPESMLAELAKDKSQFVRDRILKRRKNLPEGIKKILREFQIL